MHLLDIAENSVKAGAKLIEVAVRAENGILTIAVNDDGKGMDEEFVKRVTDPFTTTRTTRKVGLGLPLLKQAAEGAGGELEISSKLGQGTRVKATFEIDNIDRMPLGDLAETAVAMINENADIMLTYQVQENEFVFDTREIKRELDGVPIDSPEILSFLGGYLKENIERINGGIVL